MDAAILILQEDKEIIEEYVSGNSEIAATAFVRKYQTFVYSTVYRYLQSHADSDDAAQEVFIKALSNLSKFRSDSSLKTWLYRISSNVAKNALRKRKVMSIFKKNENSDLEDYDNMASGDLPPDLKFENKELEQKFSEVLATLPQKQRETFALRYFEELSYNEISDMLGTSVGGLKANYHQAVKKMAEYLKPVFYPEGSEE